MSVAEITEAEVEKIVKIPLFIYLYMSYRYGGNSFFIQASLSSYLYVYAVSRLA